MGSKKYKKENAFDDFIAKHGGDNNAWTDTERVARSRNPCCFQNNHAVLCVYIYIYIGVISMDLFCSMWCACFFGVCVCARTEMDTERVLEIETCDVFSISMVCYIYRCCQ